VINIRDALDFLERAKSSAENIERYAYDCDFGEARLVILELIAEVERLQDLIDKPPEEADWVADYHLLQSALDGPIIDAARKWHAAYRKAQNSNLMRTKEIERLRSDVNHWKLIAGEKHDDMISWLNECKKKDARIKELEAELENLNGMGTVGYMLGYKKGGDGNKVLIDYIKRLEAAFLRSNAAMRYYQEGNRGPWPQLGEKFKEPYIQKAREALEGIKEGGKDMPS